MLHSEHAQDGAHLLHASADRAGDFADADLPVCHEQLDDREGQRISEQPA